MSCGGIVYTPMPSPSRWNSHIGRRRARRHDTREVLECRRKAAGVLVPATRESASPSVPFGIATNPAMRLGGVGTAHPVGSPEVLRFPGIGIGIGPDVGVAGQGRRGIEHLEGSARPSAAPRWPGVRERRPTPCEKSIDRLRSSPLEGRGLSLRNECGDGDDVVLGHSVEHPQRDLAHDFAEPEPARPSSTASTTSARTGLGDDGDIAALAVASIRRPTRGRASSSFGRRGPSPWRSKR